MSGFLSGSDDELLMRGASGHFVMLHEVDFIFHDKLLWASKRGLPIINEWVNRILIILYPF